MVKATIDDVVLPNSSHSVAMMSESKPLSQDVLFDHCVHRSLIKSYTGVASQGRPLSVNHPFPYVFSDHDTRAVPNSAAAG
jgi:hypothetical protein